jgi:hypothetical protein
MASSWQEVIVNMPQRLISIVAAKRLKEIVVFITFYFLLFFVLLFYLRICSFVLLSKNQFFCFSIENLSFCSFDGAKVA